MLARLSLASSLALACSAASAAEWSHGSKNVPEFEPAFENQTRAPIIDIETTLETEEVASGLAHPWGIAALPGGGYLVTEREGRLRMIGSDGELVEAPIKGVPMVVNQRQGGLLDVEIADDFEESRRVFLTYSKPMANNRSVTAAATGVLSEDMTELQDVTDIFVQQPPSPTPMHYGSRIVLDGEYAFVTTGEHSSMQERVLAQDLTTTYGKVVRITLDGQVPSDNPFVGQNAVETIYTWGHRNIQGADINPATGELWTLEHGPAGGDELNRIVAGENYGWPVVSYGERYSGGPIGTGEPRAEGFVEPRYYWDPVIAPGGFVFYEGEAFADWEGDVLAASLSPGGLVRLELDGETVTGEARYLLDVGRIRDVEIGEGGELLVLVDANDGAVLRVLPPDGAGG